MTSVVGGNVALRESERGRVPLSPPGRAAAALLRHVRPRQRRRVRQPAAQVQAGLPGRAERSAPGRDRGRGRAGGPGTAEQPAPPRPCSALPAAALPRRLPFPRQRLGALGASPAPGIGPSQRGPERVSPAEAWRRHVASPVAAASIPVGLAHKTPASGGAGSGWRQRDWLCSGASSPVPLGWPRSGLCPSILMPLSSGSVCKPFCTWLCSELPPHRVAADIAFE